MTDTVRITTDDDEILSFRGSIGEVENLIESAHMEGKMTICLTRIASNEDGDTLIPLDRIKRVVAR